LKRREGALWLDSKAQEVVAVEEKGGGFVALLLGVAGWDNHVVAVLYEKKLLPGCLAVVVRLI
jgi:hypothetical protein